MYYLIEAFDANGGLVESYRFVWLEDSYAASFAQKVVRMMLLRNVDYVCVQFSKEGRA